jgi:hypothetical protein
MDNPNFSAEKKNNNSCTTEFSDLMPAKPWTSSTPVEAFQPLTDLIDKRAQSVLFRHEGKYESDGDPYDFAKQLEQQHHIERIEQFKNGVTADVKQKDGWPVRIILEDRPAHLKETSTLDPTQHAITSDKVEYCGVSRERHFSVQGVEIYRAYGFPGGKVENTGHLPELKLDDPLSHKKN